MPTRQPLDSTEYVPVAGSVMDRHPGDMVMVHLDDATGDRYWQLATVQTGTAAAGYRMRMERSGNVLTVSNTQVRGLSASEAADVR